MGSSSQGDGRSREAVEAWIAAYEGAWRSPGTDALAAVFAPDVSYRMSPYEEPVHGLEELSALWERERTGHDEEFAMRHELVALDGETAVVRVEVRYGTGAEYRDLWIVRLGE